MAKVYSLQVRPLRSSELAFHIPGILFRRSDMAYLGKSVSVPQIKIDNDNDNVDLQLGILELISNTDSIDSTGKILFDSTKIDEELSSGSLFEIYNETAKTSLDQMILQRQNAFLERYKHNSKRLAAIKRLFPDDEVFPDAENSSSTRVSGSKLWHINKIRDVSQRRHDAIDGAYSTQPINNEESDENLNVEPIDRSGVVKKQFTKTANTNNYSENNKVAATTKINPVILVTPKHTTQVRKGDDNGDLEETLVSLPVESVQYRPKKGGEQNNQPIKQIEKMGQQDEEGGYINQIITTKYPEEQGTILDQSSFSYYSEFIHPKFNNTIRNSRAQVELMQQELTDSLYALRVGDLTDIWNNELGGLDQEVRKYQIALIRTFLLPPFSGVITAIYKDVGESVEAGEPILRIEDDEDLLFVGLINHRGPLKIGDKVTIQTNDLFETGESFEHPIDVEVVSIRGHNSDNDVWDVILQGKNPLDDTGKKILPLNYHFDKDNVVVEFPSS